MCSKSAALASRRFLNRVRWTISVFKAAKKLFISALSRKFPFRLNEASCRKSRQLAIRFACVLNAPVSMMDQPFWRRRLRMTIFSVFSQRVLLRRPEIEQPTLSMVPRSLTAAR
ncbi:MAG: hypothetical protein AAF354_12425 [Pseudomonadota bacterium]